MGPPGGRKTGTRFKPRSAWLLVALLATLLLFAMAPAAAQQPYEPEIKVSALVIPHGTLVEPIRGHGQATINVTITCEPPGISMTPHEVGFRLETDEPWVGGILDKVTALTDFSTQDCLAQPATKTFDLNVMFQFNREAPYLERTEFRVFADYHGEEHLIVNWTEQAGFHERWSVRIEPFMVQAQTGQRVEMEGTVKNLGNGPIVIEVRPEPDAQHGVLTLPEPFLVPPVDEDVPGTPFPVEYLAEREGTESITLVITGAPDPSQGLELDEKTLRLHIETSDFQDIESLPGPIAPILVVVLLVLLKSTFGRSR